MFLFIPFLLKDLSCIHKYIVFFKEYDGEIQQCSNRWVSAGVKHAQSAEGRGLERVKKFFFFSFFIQFRLMQLRTGSRRRSASTFFFIQFRLIHSSTGSRRRSASTFFLFNLGLCI